jgi:hypothetical protein
VQEKVSDENTGAMPQRRLNTQINAFFRSDEKVVVAPQVEVQHMWE